MKRPHRGIYRYYCYYRWICLSHFLRAGLAQLNLARLCSKGVLGNSVIQSYRERRRLPIPISEIFGPPSPTSILLYPLFCLKGKNSPKLPWQVLESVHRTAREMTSLVNRNVCFEACLYFFQHENTSQPCILLEACLYPHSSLMMPAWGLLQMKVAPKKTVITP